MGNSQFLSRRFGAAFSDSQVTNALEEISRTIFRSQLDIIYPSMTGTWTIGIPGFKTVIGKNKWLYEWDLYRESSRRLSTSHAHHTFWQQWCQMRVLDFLAVHLNLKISDEGVADPAWAITAEILEKHSSFRKVFEQFNRTLIRVNPALAEHEWLHTLTTYVPIDWHDEAAQPETPENKLRRLIVCGSIKLNRRKPVVRGSWRLESG